MNTTKTTTKLNPGRGLAGLAETLNQGKLSSRMLGVLGLVFFLGLPAVMEPFRVQLFGQYLAFALAAVSLNLIWGYGGIMSLGHALFFGLGAYVMGYHLKLQDGMVPEFLMMNGYTQVPAILALLKSPWIAFPLVVLVPVLVALLIGWPTFRSGIKGVYFTILSQALALAFYLLFINQQQFTGGTSGIYNYAAFGGLRASRPQVLYPMYYISALILVASVFLVKAFLKTRTGQVLQAIKTGENRLKFLGYNPVPYKLFVFALSAGLAGIGGALYAIQVGSVYPTYLSINYSIMMVIWVAAGGLGSSWGPVIGAILLNWAGTFFSENLPDLWWFILGGILIGMVFLFPQGLSALKPQIDGLLQRVHKQFSGFQKAKEPRKAPGLSQNGEDEQ